MVTIAIGHREPVVLSLGLLAYMFGLRHALDADHIAAIDNATRKFAQSGRPQVATGCYFALGHSTVVMGAVLASVAAQNVTHVTLSVPVVWGSRLGVGVSAGFLYLMAVINFVILIRLCRLGKRINGQFADAVVNEQMDRLVSGRGLVARFLSRCFSVLRHSWQMYFVGLLFGLGFDSAAEILALVVSAFTSGGMLTWQVLILPALFAAGMILVDAMDGLLMLYACQVAFRTASGRHKYNLVLTAVSLAMAASVASIEVVQSIWTDVTLENDWILHVFSAIDVNQLGLLLVAVVIALISVAWFFRAREGAHDEREVFGSRAQ
ncbi:HoxN/HupN/NixA family nickel/cobalt transporter [Alicyclobacillus macrosporangiidus]|uniref:HoxN/HupN/NixA family nickel/cobalt transporter n=1 Tax=Alicyclobacillus macrosporangiidus TaxID=392015 RepID=UPI0026F00783|nr:hypothetical protein [Alicyclobacillus macrosporangiidus]